jgi:hypothetical protein
MEEEDTDDDEEMLTYTIKSSSRNKQNVNLRII